MPWFVVVHPYSTLSDCRQLATPQNAEIQKTEKFGFYRCQRATEINRSRRNLALSVHHGSALAHAALNLTSSVKRGSVQEPPKWQNLSKIVGLGYRKPTQRTHSHEISCVSVYLGSPPAHKIWPSSVNGVRYRSPPNIKICQKLWLLTKARGYAYPKIEYFSVRTYLSKNRIRVWYVSYDTLNSPRLIRNVRLPVYYSNLMKI